MMRAAIILMLIFTTPGLAAAQSEQRTCSVRFISADHAYLDAGLAEGLTSGATVTITRDGREITSLTVEHVAEHSGSCRLDPTADAVLQGDTGTYTVSVANIVTEPELEKPTRTRSRTQHVRAARQAKEGPRLSGSIAVQWEHVDDMSDADLDFDQPGLRYNVRIDRLSHDFTVRARGSLRRDLRSRAYGFAPKDAWRNRILEVSLTRMTNDADWQMAFGRVGNRVTAAVGPFDGTMINRRVGGGWRLGVFSGLTPGWKSDDIWSDDRVTGIVAHLSRGQRTSGRLDLSLAAVARRRDGEIDRDYLALSGTWRRDRLSLTQTTQLDWNRGWRSDATSQTLSLSNIMITGRWRPRDQWRLSLTVDDRDQVRTWTNRSLPDSLFADAGRRGLRAGVTWRAEQLSVRVHGGWRHNERDDDSTASYGVNIDQRNWPAAGLNIGATVRGFDGPRSRGISPSLRLQHHARTRGSTRVTIGSRTYELISFERKSTGHWLSLSHDHDLGRRWSAALEARWDGGDDSTGRRWFLELRRRL